MATPDVLTRAETADRLGVTTVTVTRWTEEGRLPALRSDPWLYERIEVDKLAAVLADKFSAKAEALRAATS